MAINFSLNTITSGFNLSKINQNFTILANGLADALSRTGSAPNSMNASLDMNSNDILNVDRITTTTLEIGGEEVLIGDIATKGDKGWGPVYGIVTDSARRVLKLVSWIGGAGTEPTDNVNEYVGTSGYVADIAQAVDLRGAQGTAGLSGSGSGDMLASLNLSDVASSSTAFTNIKQAATTSATGVVELATDAETITGTDTVRAVTPASLTAAMTPAIASAISGALTLSAFDFLIGCSFDFTGSEANVPTGFILPYGQAISRTTYSKYFAIVGTTYGAGNGTTTFNAPDIRGRVIAGKDNMGGTSANRLTDLSGGVNGDTLGDAGGLETHVLTEAQLATHDHSVNPPITTTSSDTHSHTITSDESRFGSNHYSGTDTNFYTASGDSAWGGVKTQSTNSDAHTHTVDIAAFNSANAGSGQAHNNVQPTFICNKIIFIGL